MQQDNNKVPTNISQTRLQAASQLDEALIGGKNNFSGARKKHVLFFYLLYD